jgi:segregation and condensation protein B
MSEEELEENIEIADIDSSEDESAAKGPVAEIDTMRILEALLFASDELLTIQRIKTIIPGSPDGKQIRKMVDKLNVQLQKERHPFEIVEVGGGYQFRTVSFYHTWVRQLFKEKASKKLSVQALECLAIIAYKQPLSKAEIEAIRGVVSDGAMKTLLEKRLVTIYGRSEKPGRPLLYATTQEFLKYFGLNKIADLPRMEEFEAIAREKMEDLSIEELQQNDGENANENQQDGTDTESAIEFSESNNPADLSVNPDTQVTDSTAVFEIDIAEGDASGEFNPEHSPETETQVFDKGLFALKDDHEEYLDSGESDNLNQDESDELLEEVIDLEIALEAEELANVDLDTVLLETEDEMPKDLAEEALFDGKSTDEDFMEETAMLSNDSEESDSKKGPVDGIRDDDLEEFLPDDQGKK